MSNPITENHIREESIKKPKKFSLVRYAIVPPEMFCEAKMRLIYVFGRGPPLAPLGEFTTLPQTP